MSFTEEEKNIINDIYKRNFANMTPEEVQLYARWNAENALRDAEFQTKMENMRLLMQARINAANEAKTAAIDNLKAQKALALAKLERVRNGEH